MTDMEYLNNIIDEEYITTVYQPIVSLDNGSIFGYEALSRITLRGCTINIEELFAMAASKKKLWQLERLCRETAIKNAKSKPMHSKLFINVDSNIIHDPEMKTGFTYEKLKEYKLNPEEIVFEITEQNAVKSMELFKESIEHYRNQNFNIAVDDFGTAYSGLKRVCSLHPEYIKIDMSLIRDIDKDPLKKSAVASTIDFCRDNGIKVIAEGIETKEELKTLAVLGADYGQGYFLGHPHYEFQTPSTEISDMIKHINKFSSFKRGIAVLGKIGSITKCSDPVPMDTPSIDIFEEMKDNYDMTEVFVVDEEKRVKGILTRAYLFEQYGGQYGYVLSRRMNAGRLMEKDFLSVDSTMSIESVVSIAMKRNSEQTYYPIAVTSEGRYMGSVSVKDLLLRTIKVKEERAINTNPLTKLPGNSTIQKVMESTIEDTENWAVIYLDLDNFKAYNDAYGFPKGDQMIKAAAHAMESACSCGEFLGHIGGDDFVIISSKDQAEKLCGNIISNFSSSILDLYCKYDRDRGYIVSVDRNGFTQKFPMVTMSIAVITSDKTKIDNISELSGIIAATKKKAKQVTGNSVIVA